MRRVLPLVGLVVSLALAGCTGSVSPGPSGSALITSPSAVPSGRVSTSTTAVACTAPQVSVSGAPFCYTQPTGFADLSKTAGYAAGWTYRTMVGFDGQERIEVLAQPVGLNLDALTTAQAADYAQRFGLAAGRDSVRAATPLVLGTVGGARAFRQRVVYATRVTATSSVVLRGHSLVYVSCQYLRHPQALARGCAQVLGSMRIAYR